MDGTVAGTVAIDVAPGTPSANPRALVGIGDRLYFGATDAAYSVEPSVAKGSQVTRVGDVNPGRLPSSPGQFTKLGNNVLFVADDGLHGFEVWKVPLQ